MQSRPPAGRAPTFSPAAWALAVALMVNASACDRPGAPTGHEVVVDTLTEGTVRISNSEVGRWGAEEGWELEEELRIGSLDGTGPASFGNIAALAVDGTDQIWVLDNQARELKIFDSDGIHLRTLGGQGGGPGEFGNPVGLAVDPVVGSVWVVDPGNGRYTAFSSNGELLGTHPRPIGYFAWPWPGGFTAQGELVDVVPGGLVRLTGEMVPVDTLTLPQDDGPRLRIASSDGVMRMSMVPPFAPWLRWRFDPAGSVWFGVSDQFHFTRRSLDGQDDRIVRRRHEPVEVTAAEADSARRTIDERIAMSGAGADAQVEGDRSIPSHKPAFTTFLVDDASRLWVERQRHAEDPGRRLEVFDTDGTYLGAVAIPEGLQTVSTLPIFRGEHLYAVVTDELDLPYVMRYRIRR